MKKILYILLAVASVACHNEDNYNTDHPSQGKLTLTTDWSNRNNAIAIPASYTVESAGTKVTLTGTTAEYPRLLDPGTYALNLYNTADKITVSGTTATVAAEGTGVAAMPGWLFGGATTVEIKEDTDHTQTVVMQQLVRELTMTLAPSGDAVDRIATVAATLSGVASQVDIATGAVSGTATTVVPVFTKQSDGKYKATVRLVGVTGGTQKLTLTLTYAGSSPATHTIESDMTAVLSDFNSDRKTPKAITGTMSTPTLANPNGTITGWVPNDNEIGTAVEYITYKLGDYYPDPNVTFNDDKTVKTGIAPVGIVFDLENPVEGKSQHGKIVSLVEGDQKWNQWVGEYGAISTTDGRANTDAMVAIGTENPSWTPFYACLWCVGRGPGWYFPAKEEVLTLYATWNGGSTTENVTARADFNTKLTTAGGTDISTILYWSSTAYSNSHAVCVNFSNGITGNYLIDRTYRVRAAFAF